MAVVQKDQDTREGRVNLKLDAFVARDLLLSIGVVPSTLALETVTSKLTQVRRRRELEFRGYASSADSKQLAHRHAIRSLEKARAREKRLRLGKIEDCEKLKRALLERGVSVPELVMILRGKSHSKTDTINNDTLHT